MTAPQHQTMGAMLIPDFSSDLASTPAEPYLSELASNMGGTNHFHHEPVFTSKIPSKDDIAFQGVEEIGDMVSEPDTEAEDAEIPKLPRITERRRVENAKFASWLSRRAEKVTKEEVKAAVARADDEALSIRNLMSKQESTVIITDPREYQLELYEKAKKQNIIAVLDTGSGKTLIAVLLLRHILDQELEDRSMGKRHRIAFFLVDCVTLVFQQFAVLECNLDQKMERFCGDMGCDLWDRKTWEKHFSENMIIVCTAEVLYQCLMHSFISVDQINLLIFDEAHHAKKNHAYARIVKDFYIPQHVLEKRPKIFGMTASPVDAKEDIVKAAKQLETLLHCQIATTSDLSLLRMSISKPDESIAAYAPLCHPYQTRLCAELEARFGDIAVLSKLFRFSRAATSELGEWCADVVWTLGLAIEEARKVEGKLERSFLADEDNRPIEMLDAELRRLREARDVVSNWTLLPPLAEGNLLSPKVLLLKNYLELVFEKPTGARCIVFVKRRYTARVLAELFAQWKMPNLHLGLLIGTRQGDPGDVKISFRQQVLTLMKFKKGEVNCLFATAIAEEGLDIPNCNLIVRFDLYETLIQYIQSRGRARHANSKYIHMIEDGNPLHIQGVRNVRLGEEVMRKFCEALPADRLLQGSDVSLDSTLAKERSLRSYTDPVTGAKLTYGSSLVVLAHFIGCLPHHSETNLQASYAITVENKLYVCEVILPESSPIHSATGRPSSKRAVAKRSAAFEACILLRKGGYLDSNLLPIYHKQLPAMRNAHLALNMKRSGNYTMRLKPSLWETTRGSAPDEFYLTALELETPENLGRPCQPLALLTRTRLPEIPAFTAYLQVQKTSEVLCTSIAQSFRPTTTELEHLTTFTLRIYKDVFNKTYETNQSQMSYWLAPILSESRVTTEEQSAERLIDWPTVKNVYENEELKWTMATPHSWLSNRYVIDRWDGGRRFFSDKVVPEMRPLDPLPAGCAPHRYDQNILDYSVSLFSKARGRAKWQDDQPVFLAHRNLHRLNWLDQLQEQELKAMTVSYLCPEPLKFSALPTTVAAMSYLFSAIIHRIDAYLIALEACEMLGLEIKPHLALEAVTKDSDNTDEHRAEQIHVQRGMGRNYERLEFIGDCFLKMATSISLFAKNPDNDEYEFHVKRMLLLCNKTLFDNALQLKLYEYIRTQGFSRRTWYPQGLKLLEGKGSTKTGTEVHKHQLGDKSIADVCEALIGAALLSYQSTGNMDMAVKAVTVMVSSPQHDVSKWEDYYKLYTKPRYQLASSSAATLDLAIKIEQKHGYHFNYPRLLQSAFIHPSCPFAWQKIPCYQRLEFLGDSLLDMACVNFLFYRHPDRDPQWLTEHKMAMVSNKFFGALAVKLGFNKHLRFNGPGVQYEIGQYVAEYEEVERESKGSRDYWTLTKDPPKCLPDIVEAYVGAIFVDSEFNYKVVEHFFDTHIRWFFEDMNIYDTFANNHPTTYLHSLLTNNFGCTHYRLMANELPSIDGSPIVVVAVVMIHEEIVTDAQASSGKNAKVKASANALKLLAGVAPFEFRAKYMCDCGRVKGEEVG